jgi:Putative esterase
MESYITAELPKALFASFPELDSSRVSITGHSMGGHGALTLFLKNPGMYKSVSAFAPIANPSNCPWGEKAFKGYLGEDREIWKKHDASELIKGWKAGTFEALIDVGTGDNFYKQGQLLPENFEKSSKESGNDKGLVLRYQDVSGDLEREKKDFQKVLTKDRVTTTLIILFRRFQQIMSIMRRNICLQHSMLLLFFYLESESCSRTQKRHGLEAKAIEWIIQ